MQTKATENAKEKEQGSGSGKLYKESFTALRQPAAPKPDPVEIVRRIRQNPSALTRQDTLVLRQTMGERAVMQLLSRLAGARKDEPAAAKDAGKENGQNAGNAAEKTPETQPAVQEAKGIGTAETFAEAPILLAQPLEPEAKAGAASPAAQQTPAANEAQPAKQEQPAQQPNAVAEALPAKQEAEVEPAVALQQSEVKNEPAVNQSVQAGQKTGKQFKAAPDLAGKAANEAKSAKEEKEEAKAAKADENQAKAESNANSKAGNDEVKEGKPEAKADKGAPEEAKASKDGKDGKDGKEAQKKEAEGSGGKGPSLADALGALADDKEAPAKAKKVTIRAEEPGEVFSQLAQVPPTEMKEAYSQAITVSAGALDKQKAKTQQALPVIPAPTGLAGKLRKASAKLQPLAHKAPESFKSERTGGAGSGNLPGMDIRSGGSNDNPDAIMSEIRSASAQRPNVNLSGEADPSQVEGFSKEASQQAGTAKKAELKQLNAPFGENDIFPEPDHGQLKAKKPLQGGKHPGAKPLPQLAVPGAMTAGLNKSLAPELKKELGAKQAEYGKEKAKFDTAVASSKADSQAEIRQAETEARNKQLSEQAGAKGEVDKLKGEWRSELDAAEAEYAGQAGSAVQQKKGEIEQTRTEKEQEAQKRQSEAEQEATKEYGKAKKEADGKQQEEKAKEEKKSGFLGWVKDKLDAVVAAVKKVVNFIFEGLRKAVKFIFEKAKQAIIGIIELGRKLITGMIKALGTLLKGLVKVLLAKFPAIAKKICDKIDGAVNKAVKAVNAIAEKLKTKAAQIIDALAAKVDQALAAVQAFYNKLISALGTFLIGGILDIMERIGALGTAAKRSFSHLEGKMWEYLLGVDISKPLGAQAAEGEAEESAEAGQQPEEELKLSDNDIEIESVEEGEMEPELVEELNLKDGETKEMPGSSDPVTTESIMKEFDTGKQEQSLGQKVAEGASLRANNAKMVFDQIKTYVINWMKAHGLQLLGGILAALATVAVLGMVTGGAALPVIINLISVAMQAMTIKSVMETLAQAATHIGTYLSQGWQKMIDPAAIALATAMAMGLVELAMELGMKGLGKGLKKAGTAVKKGVGAAAKGVKKAVGAGAKGLKSLLKSGVNLASKSGSMILRNGKIVIKSLQKGFMKGVKKLQGLIGRILGKFKFKKFKLERKGKHIRLYGEVNPWVLLADGTIEEVDDLNGKKYGIKTEAELNKLKDLSIDERKLVFNQAKDGKIDFDNIKKQTPKESTEVKNGDQFTKGKNNRKELAPNVQYVTGNGYKYKTDNLGRIESVEADSLELKTASRNAGMQRAAGREDRLKTDDGGHLIGSQFNGSGDIDNLVAQNSQINRSGGEWYKMETEWAEALSEVPPRKVSVKIKVNYSSDSLRPDSFSIFYEIEGEELIEKIIKNQAGG
ncbi:DNA/RNA non-specific endonuclease [Paenibacillus macerans]|uniref:DNA/RNA non-specific endonuclease n=1 Tax=Paenibacillus macerans TaxID=44252 RepID=UPI00203F255D|nr:DNA/RNA non-specific endonuclease [Paenibacillus macerans]MCM3702388.1 DNA/RNA non-specific endonuclease [Paenibacillus macerans]